MTRIELLEYALDGARTRRGLLCNFPEDLEEAKQIEDDIWRIKAKLMRAKLNKILKDQTIGGFK